MNEDEWESVTLIVTEDWNCHETFCLTAINWESDSSSMSGSTPCITYFGSAGALPEVTPKQSPLSIFIFGQ